MTSRFLSSLVLAVTLSACGPSPVQQSQMQYAVSNSARVESFERCLAAVPAGPTTTTFNDWSEVVKRCATFAENSAAVCRVKTGCTAPYTPHYYHPVIE